MPTNRKPSFCLCHWNHVKMAIREINQLTLTRKKFSVLSFFKFNWWISPRDKFVSNLVWLQQIISIKMKCRLRQWVIAQSLADAKREGATEFNQTTVIICHRLWENMNLLAKVWKSVHFCNFMKFYFYGLAQIISTKMKSRLRYRMPLFRTQEYLKFVC